MKVKPRNRNNERTGHNSMCYNDKHFDNPVSLRPIHDAINKVPRIVDMKGYSRPNYKRIKQLRWIGGRMAKPQLCSYLAAISNP